MKINKTKLGLYMAINGLNFIDLSKESNVSRATLSYINNGKECRPNIVAKIASALKVEVNDLIED